MNVEHYVPLAARCTLGVGGPARFFVRAQDEATLVEALEWADRGGIPVRVLGSGSNVVIADEGVDGLVVRVMLRGRKVREDGDRVELTVSAGEPWDDVVETAVGRGLSGVECLSGIPGLVGAAPIQNIGAYGQDVSQTIVRVRAYDRIAREVVTLTREECGFGYRDSVFKSVAPDRWVVLDVTFRLAKNGAPTVAYAELERALAEEKTGAPTLVDVRRIVLALRAGKSMVLDPNDPNRRSCGSFFVNPVVSAEELPRIERRVGNVPPMPQFPQPDGQVKLSAAFLIERAGFEKAQRRGPVGISSRHALAVVCHEGAHATDVLSFAREIRDRVRDRFGVTLVLEPVLWGFRGDPML
ncbi:MAG TPA: UDP-N-acetylmuramate dehydrogenase [Polyangiaceae bacterium]|nr:UDP-N-acetylmuramate dehydrogenase [Polyangiaceae bacterium]